LDAFEECVEYHPRAEAIRTAWMAGARAFTDEFGEDGELVKRAYRKMQNANLTVATPRSLITLARKLRESEAVLSDIGLGRCPTCEQEPCECEVQQLEHCPACGNLVLAENIGQDCKWHKGLPHQQYARE
jgi:hypothetical protein